MKRKIFLSPALRILAAVAALLVVAAGVFVLLRAFRIRKRHRAAFGAPLPALDPDRERLLDAPRALYHGTRFADGAAVLAPRWADPCVGDLWCTDEAIFLQREAGGGRLCWPLAWIEDAALLRAHAELAGKELPMVHIRFRRGGEALVSDFSLRGGMANLEKLRREVHLRQGTHNALALLGDLLTKEPVPGSGPPP
ncbi:MAG TPA: hypothetical protein VEQ15_16130 [Myxococcales bacterium]|nr:hypothetical protein [Myxococcales bacterium]